MKTLPRRFVVFVAFLLSVVVARAIIGTGLQEQLGNPSGATADPTNHSRYLIQRAQYSMDFSDTLGDPNWVSWNLTTADVGSSGRSSFLPDPGLPAGFYAVVTGDYTGSGYDRGHMCPSADRTVSAADNQIVFYMTNIVPQTSDNNQGPWASFETYCRTLAGAGNELLIVTGPGGFAGSRIPSGKAAIPGFTWKIAVVVPAGAGTAASRIDANTRVIALKMPNVAGIRSNPWQNYIVSAGSLETDTGLTFFSALSPSIAAALRLKVDGQTSTGAPVITGQPTAQTSAVGGSATFSVTATGDAPLSYQWLKDDVEIADATSSTLTINPVQAADAANYTVVVTNNVGTVTSNAAALIVTGVAPSITTQPVARTANAGTTVTFSVGASGSPTLAYQWRKAGTNLTNGGNVSGATAPTLTLTNVQAADAAAYDVVVTNSVSSATSNTAALTVTPTAPSITSQPAAQSLAPGSTATFTVVATGTAPLAYQWRKGGTNLANGGNVAGATSATLTLTGIGASDAANYDVVVSNGVSPDATSATASLTLTNASATLVFYTGGTYTQNFDSLPNTGTFTFSGAGPFYVANTVANAGVNATNAGGWAFTKISGSGSNALFAFGTGSSNTGAVYSFGASAATDRAFGALLSGTAGHALGVAIVNNTGQTITQFTVAYTGEQWRWGAGTAPPDRLAFEYQVGAANIAASTGWTAATSLDFTSRITTGSAAALDGNNSNNRLAINATVTGVSWGAGQTLVLRWRDIDTSGSDDGLAIDDFSFATPVTGPVGPSVASTTPANASTGAALNSPIAITFDQAVNVSGAWFSLSSASQGALSATVTASGDARTYTLAAPANFNFSDTITVNVLAGQVTSQSTGLHPASDYTFSFTTAAPVAPSIGTHPSTQTVAAGSTVNFTVVASGTAPLSYQWRKAGNPISGNASASTATLTLTNVQAADADSYDVIVSNGVNPAATSNPATLTVTPAAPTIVTPPAAQVVTAGDTATFNVAATGTAPLVYQWRKGGTPLSNGSGISGATTATLTIANTTSASAGSYDVVVSNGINPDATSAAATLTVNAAPVGFTVGNILVARVGNGTGSLVNTGNPVFLDEYAPTGTLVQSIALPTAASGSNRAFVIGGTSTTEGGLSRSPDGRYVVMTGYGTSPGGATSLSGTTASSVNRVVARIDANGVANTSTALTDYASSASPRSGVTADGSAFWVVGGAGGVRYAPLGATTSSSISSTIDNLRVAEIAGAQLVVSTQSGSTVRIGLVGTGLPTTTGQAITALPGVPTTISPNAFFFADLDATVTGADTLYVADESAGLIRKYCLVGTTWTDVGSVTATSVRGLTGITAGGSVSIYGTTGGSSATGGGALYKFVDSSGYNGALTGAAATIATPAANTAFRGVALAPVAAPAIVTPPVAQTITSGQDVTFTVVTSGSEPETLQWRRNGVDLVDGSGISGATTRRLTLTAATTARAGDYTVVVRNPLDSTGVTSAAATLTVNKIAATVVLGGLSATYTGSPISATATTTPTGLPVTLTYDGSGTAPTNAGSYAVVATINHSEYSGTATGTLVIAKATATVALGSLAQVYNGSARNATATTTPAGLTVDLTYNGSATVPVNAGSYTVVGTINNANYAGSATGTLVVSPAAATISLGNLNFIYDGSPKSVAPTTSPSGLPVFVTYNSAGTLPVNAGSYAVLASINTQNYSGTAAGTLVIAPGTQTIAFGAVPATITVGTAFTVSATASSGLPVTLVVASGNATLSGSSLTLNDASPVTLRATQAGNANLAATTADLVLAAGKQSQTITFGALADRPSDASPFTLGATASSGLPVSFSIVSGPATISGSTVTLTGAAGTVVVRAAQAGNATYAAAGNVDRSFNVTAAPTAPVITTQPLAQTALIGANVSFSVVATGGTPALTYQWRKDGSPIAGATNATLTLTSVAANAGGSYDVVVTNAIGSTTSALARLTINVAATAPIIARQPANLALLIGRTATFSVAASGAPAPTFQWRKDGVAISGATSDTLTLANIGTADAGTYIVVVTNSAGSVTSSAATLAVIRRSFAGTYFGSLGNGGTFALRINDDNTGVFLAFAPGFRTAYVSRSVVVDDEGRFRFTVSTASAPTITPSSADTPQIAAAVNDLVFDGTINASGTITATGTGAAATTLSGSKTPDNGIAGAGFYEAGAANSSATALAIIAPNGQALVVTQNGTAVDGGSGTVNATGQLAVTTADRVAITGSVSAAAGSLTAAAGSTTFSGFDRNASAVADQRVANISTRTSAGAADQPAIVGFVITGLEVKTVLIRAVGPTLRNFGVGSAIAAPKLELMRPGTAAPIATNTGWTAAGNAAEISAAATRSGAFPLAANSADSAILTTLAPGSYTAVVTAADGRAGVTLVEVYDLSGGSSLQRLANLSTRATTGTGDATLIAGVVVTGSAPKRLLIRAAGPALTQFGVPGALARPQLTLTTLAGAPIAQNAGWSTSPDAAAIAEATSRVGAFAFGATSSDSALLVNLPPGGYTATVTGVAGTNGVALIEVYEVP